ncbi:MAG: class I SAM-dependent methyltransferase [Vicinamibacterales bacterium]
MTRAGGYNPDFYSPLFDAEDRHFWFRSRNCVLEQIIAAETAPFADGFRVLEVGCGTGYVLRMLHETCRRGCVIGMDLFADGLVLAKQRSAAPVVRGTIEAAPFALPFDLIGLFDTLEHIDDDAAVLDNLRKLLRSGGVLCVTVPAYEELWSDFDVESQHCRRYSPEVLYARLRKAGFTIDYLTPFMATLYPLARIGRLWSDARRRRNRDGGTDGKSAVVDQLRIRPGINGMLTLLLAQEARLIAARKQLPIGTSLLAVARVP